MKNLSIFHLKKIQSLKNLELDTLKNISKSKGRYLVQSLQEAHNFDKLHENYAIEKSISKMHTADALLPISNTYYFIEFKNAAVVKGNLLESVFFKMIKSPECLGLLLVHHNKIKRWEEIYYRNLKFITVYSYDHYRAHCVQTQDGSVEEVEANERHRNRNRFVIYKHEILEGMMGQWSPKPYSKTISVDNVTFEEFICSI